MPEPLTVPSLTEALAESLRRSILSGELLGGSAVTEKDVAQRYDVARPTARAAIERLLTTGLLHRTRHKSARVPALTATDIRDVYFARTCLESAAAYELSTGDGAPPGAQVAIKDLRHAANDEDIAIVEADLRFHTLLVDAVGSVRLTRMHVALMGEMQLSMAQVRAHKLLEPDVIAADHQRIIDAVTNRDPGKATSAVVDHLERACAVLTRHLGAGMGPSDTQSR